MCRSTRVSLWRVISLALLVVLTITGVQVLVASGDQKYEGVPGAREQLLAELRPGQAAILPPLDGLGQRISGTVLVVQLPDCMACSMSKVDIPALEKLSWGRSIVLSFPNSRAEALKKLATDRFGPVRFLFKEQGSIFPAQLVDAAPFAVVVDTERGEILKVQPASVEPMTYIAENTL